MGPGARGEDGKLVALDVKAGDRVLFGKWSGTEVKIDGQDLLIMKETDILASSPKQGIDEKWLPKKLNSVPMPARVCCVASTSWPTR